MSLHTNSSHQPTVFAQLCVPPLTMITALGEWVVPWTLSPSVPRSLNDLEQCDIVEHLVSIVPSIQDPLSGIVVHHGDV